MAWLYEMGVGKKGKYKYRVDINITNFKFV
jgi:hypothetical protein